LFDKFLERSLQLLGLLRSDAAVEELGLRQARDQSLGDGSGT
jgi:hypothetical protein